MKNLKHSKYKNTAILFEMLVRKLTSESMTSDKTTTVDIIKQYFGKNTELSKELQLYNSLIKEQVKSEAKALDFIRTCKSAHSTLNKSTLKRQRYNLVKTISEKFNFQKVSKIRINNYKTLASIYKLFEYAEVDNPKQLMESKDVIVDHLIINDTPKTEVDKIIETYKSQNKDLRLLSYTLLVDKFNEKYSNLNESQRNLLREYINNLSNTNSLREFIDAEVMKIRKVLSKHLNTVDDKITKIKLTEAINHTETATGGTHVRDSHVVSLMRYYELVKELENVHTRK